MTIMSPSKKAPKATGKHGKTGGHKVVREPAVKGYTAMKASVFKAKCLDLMDEVNERHVSIVVTKHGKPVAKLTPVDDTPPNPIGFLRGTIVSDHGILGPEDEAWGEAELEPLG
ncbi:MAG: type II toxin-antitoxin system Phd/YefM family antitoxin [Gemmatimonadaceae bacterium]